MITDAEIAEIVAHAEKWERIAAEPPHARLRAAVLELVADNLRLVAALRESMLERDHAYEDAAEATDISVRIGETLEEAQTEVARRKARCIELENECARLDAKATASSVAKRVREEERDEALAKIATAETRAVAWALEAAVKVIMEHGPPQSQPGGAWAQDCIDHIEMLDAETVCREAREAEPA